jgi:hypothetical protein
MPDPGTLTARQQTWFSAVQDSLERDTGKSLHAWAGFANGSVDPSSGGDAIVSNDFAVIENNSRGGPVASVNNPVPIHLDAKNRVYGIGIGTYDTNCACTQYWENIYMITP